ncbi:unnamed protein product [Heligmosomoides polygyrus]|uniref:Uncharacterized protein n=1 Tax=Heligmosomoides polygyrus TaxID=6339 RepID=A0A183FKC2_HELPZ|nr:unnamed protein product [Heligmosomoides polygyrus]
MTSYTYIVLEEAEIKDLSQHQQLTAIDRIKPSGDTPPPLATAQEDEDDGTEEDATGIEEKDIEWLCPRRTPLATKREEPFR